MFDSEHGYYSKNIQTVGGRSADFATTATLSDLLARGLAHSISSWIKHDKISRPNIIEVGAGDGSLARSILKHLPLVARLRLRYHIVEASPPLKHQQKAKLGKKAQWHSDIKDALVASEGKAFVFSNELVDAFPVRVFRYTQHLEELHFDGTQEHFLPCGEPPNSSSLTSIPEGQRREVHDSYHSWLKDWLPLWKSGRIITIDYGAKYPELYYRRPNGTLRAYFRHQYLTGSAIYQNIGHQDITCDVNFTDLINWSAALELETVDYQSQRDFLLPFNSGSEVDNFLLSEGGAGEAFQVLTQVRTHSILNPF